MDSYRRTKAEQGQILPIFSLMLALLLLPVAGLAVDGGLLMASHATAVGAAQAAAEAAAQAVDVTAVQNDDTFQLCAVPDGGATCGNGVGTVGEVVDEVIAASYPSQPPVCTDEGTAPLPVAPAQGLGCAFDVVSSCALATSAGSDSGPPPEGVSVLTWQTVQLPISLFPGWTSVRLRASATAWMEHGFAEPSSTSVSGGSSC
ncbi:MAG TPA: pilus assembly protein TadG-related protein [Candidatus Dormibacteraeota bacterium]|nr:pilus assembly protein TadG-related protein [Candidatus Dormibacteraeota bacterium]